MYKTFNAYLLKHWKFILIFFLSLMVFVEPVSATQILDAVGNKYRSVASGWEGSLMSIAKGTFGKLATLEIAWFAVTNVLEHHDDPFRILAGLLKRVVGLGFFYAILVNFDSWIPAIIQSFSQAGQAASGTGNLTPSTILDSGIELATLLINSAPSVSMTGDGLGTYIFALLVAVITVVCFCVAAGQMLITLVESYICVYGGVLFLGFAGSRWTTTFAEKYISYVVSVGVKLFVIYLIVGAGESLVTGWGTGITEGMQCADYLSVMTGSIIFMFLCWQIPALASSMLTGSVSMTLGSVMATAGTMAAAGLGAAAATSAVASTTGSGLAGAVQAGVAGVKQAKAEGASGFMQTATGAAGAVGSAMMDAASDKIKSLGMDSAGGGLANRINQKTDQINETNAAASEGLSSSAPGGNSSSSTSAAPGETTAPAGSSSSTSAAPGGADVAAPNAGNDDKSVFSKIAEHAEAIGKMPNDAAGGAGVQINLKHTD